MNEHWGKFYLCPMDKKMISLILNSVSENVLVCAQFSSNRLHGT